VKKETMKKYTSSHEEGLRALARIIARTYMRDMREKTATMQNNHKLKNEKRIRNNNKGGKTCQRKKQ
jgi:hypothetical protein